jgi:hypothetical protein
VLNIPGLPETRPYLYKATFLTPLEAQDYFDRIMVELQPKNGVCRHIRQAPFRQARLQHGLCRLPSIAMGRSRNKSRQIGSTTLHTRAGAT